MTQPRRLGNRYEIGPLIGRGGMAEVHRGRDTRLNRDVAIKLLRADLARDPSFQTRFRREAQAAAGLNHPAIVSVYDTGEDEQPGAVPTPYIVMEFVDGRTLREVMQADGRFAPRRAIEITAAVCAALDFSHRNGIIHRDVKPGNVMITSSGAVKVMDFGIARAITDSSATMTATAQVIGTAQYLSPEQARGETVDARSDVYSTGCLLYELVTGNPPFTGDSPVAVAYQHVRETPAPPSSANPAVTPQLDAIILKSLNKNPANRYQSAGEMGADLERAAAGQQVTAEPVMSDSERTVMMAGTGSHRAPVIPPERNHRRTAGYAGLALAVILIVAAVAFGITRLVQGNGSSSDPTSNPATLTSSTPPPTTSSSPTPQLVAVPSVQGFSQKKAVEMLKAAGLVPRESPVKSSAGDKGNVIGQNPTANVNVAPGSTVTITVGQGPTTATIPPVDNLTVADATAQLKSAGFALVTNQPRNDVAASGTVVDSTPKQGTQADPSITTVTLYVSTGKLQIPNVTDESLGNATADLQKNHFSNIADPTYQVSQDFAPGTVIQQSPKGGSVVPPKDPVTLVVAKAAPTTPPTTPSTTPPPTTTPSTTPPPTTTPSTTPPPTTTPSTTPPPTTPSTTPPPSSTPPSSLSPSSPPSPSSSGPLQRPAPGSSPPGHREKKRHAS